MPKRAEAQAQKEEWFYLRFFSFASVLPL